MLDPREVLGEQEHATPCPAEALVSASRWLAGYESFITRIAGLGHRVPRPDSAPSSAPPRPCSLDPAGDEMARRAKRSPRHHAALRDPLGRREARCYASTVTTVSPTLDQRYSQAIVAAGTCTQPCEPCSG
jgi:hypothetical protein